MHLQLGPLPLAGLPATLVFLVLCGIFTVLASWIADRVGPEHPVPDLRLRVLPILVGIVLAVGTSIVVTLLSRR